MYKYLLFHGQTHEACGGMDDLALKFNTFDDFEKHYYFSLYNNWYQLVDTRDYSVRDFSSKIIWHVGRDDKNDIMNQRKQEFLEWVKSNVESV